MQDMEPLTTKELEYLADSMSNEDLLIKQCAAAASSIANPRLQQLCNHMANVHTHHYLVLLDSLQQHHALAPGMTY